jgi:acyl carrier protein
MTETIELTSVATTADSKGSIILSGLLEILEDMIADWDMDLDTPLGPDTTLIADLGFESIDVVQFVAAIEEHFLNRAIPFEELVMRDGRYVDEINVGAVKDFLTLHLTV